MTTLERAPAGAEYLVRVARLHNGETVPSDEQLTWHLRCHPGHVELKVEAPYFGDPVPGGPPGSTPRLWEHEVAELMLLGEKNSYLEIELAPHGHYLVLQLEGYRNIVAEGLPLQYQVNRSERRWLGTAFLSMDFLPRRCQRLNAFAMHGAGVRRRYLCWRPNSSPRPDFHDLPAFGSLDECAVRR